MQRYLLLILCSLFLLCQGGCAGKAKSSFNREDADLSLVRSIAVLPFENNSGDKYATERIRDLCISTILSSRLFDVVDKGIVDGVLKEEAVTEPGAMNRQVIKRLGQQLGVQALLVGTVDTAGEVRRGSVSFPEVAMTLRLLDINSGTILWNASGTRNGDSVMRQLFGLKTDDAYTVASRLTRDLLATIDLSPPSPEPEVLPTEELQAAPAAAAVEKQADDAEAQQEEESGVAPEEEDLENSGELGDDEATDAGP
ncbi:MAG: GNA1162 family protein [Thermodesulfobacteriota bacterium]